MRRALGLVFVVGVAAPAVAQNMPLTEFMPRAEKLQQKGMAALFSSDLKPLFNEMTGAFKAYRDDLKSEVAAHHPSSCPPEGTRLSSDDVMKSFETIPVDQRRSYTTKSAVARLMIQRFPCKA